MCLECGTTFSDIVRHLRRRQIVRDALTAGFAIAPPAVKHSQAPSALAASLSREPQMFGCAVYFVTENLPGGYSHEILPK